MVQQMWNLKRLPIFKRLCFLVQYEAEDSRERITGEIILWLTTVKESNDQSDLNSRVTFVKYCDGRETTPYL